MSKLQELINELCPEGVEFRKLGEVCKILRGRRLTTRDLHLDGEFPVFHGGIEPIGFYETNNREANSVMVINVGASAGTVGFCNKRFWSSDGCFCFTHNIIINQRYLFFVLQSIEPSIKSKVRKAGIPTLDNKEVERLIIPLPPLEVQNEIVRILDTFTSHAAELQARKEQYEYYRNKLLSFDENDEGVKWMKLGEIGSFKYGFTDKAKKEGEIRYIRITDIMDNGCLNPNDAMYINASEESSKYLLKEGDILVARTGATFGKTLYLQKTSPSVYASFLIKIDLNNELITNKFYWYFSKSKFYWKQANKLVSRGGQQQFNANAISQVEVPIPPLSEQQRIVSILDKFESLVNDLTAGLPAEIAAVQEQYEYYRNKLLTFKRIS